MVIFIDIVVILALFYGFIKGFNRGFIVSFASFLAVIFGIAGALHLVPWVSYMVFEWFNINSVIVPLIAFVLIFVVILWIIKIVAKLLTRVINMVFFGFFNKLGGAVFGFIITGFMLSLLIWLFNNMNFIPPEYKINSFTYKYLEPVSDMIFGVLGYIIPSLDEIREGIEHIFKDPAAPPPYVKHA